MKKSFLFIASLCLLMGIWSCSSDSKDEPNLENKKQETPKQDGEDGDDDGGYCVDYYPVCFELLVLNSKGENLLEPSTSENILDSEMYMLFGDERYEVNYGRPENSYFPGPSYTRVYLPMWYGAFIAPYWYQYPDLPDRDNRLHIGEFEGGIRGKVMFELVLNNHHYIIGYENKKIEGLDIDRHFYLDDNEIDSGIITIVL